MTELGHIDGNKGRGKKSESRLIYEEYSGPVARPEDFEKYEEVLPGAADRILKMAEKEQGFRHGITKQDMRLYHFGKLLSLFFGFIIAMTVILGGFYLLYHDKDLAGYTALLGGLASLVGLFVFRERIRSKKSEEKQKKDS